MQLRLEEAHTLLVECSGSGEPQIRSVTIVLDVQALEAALSVAAS